MTNNKKLRSVLAGVMAMSMLAACSSGTPAASAASSEAAPSGSVASGGHTHTAVLWDRDVNTHWQNCDCGETFNVGDHTLGEDIVCTECGSEVWMYDSGAEVYNYTENGEFLRITAYDPDGAVVQDMRWDYEYDADGNCTKVTSYYDDVPVEVTEYHIGAAEGEAAYTRTVYYDDGTTSVGEFTEYGETIRNTEYAADGTESVRMESEFAEVDGTRYVAKELTYYSGVLGLIREYNQYGDDLLFREVDENGNTVSEMSHEYTYSADGIKENSKFFVNGVLVQDDFYTFVENDFGGDVVNTRGLYYNEDGTVEETIYSEASGYNETEKIILYDADGTTLSEANFEMTFDQDGNLLTRNTYIDGVLAAEEVFEVINTDELYTHYCKTQTIYNEDGTKQVTEFDQDGETVSDTLYDANGNAVA